MTQRVIKFRGKKVATRQPGNLDVFTEIEKTGDWVYGVFSNGIGGRGAYIMPDCYTSGLVVISEEEDEDGNDISEYGTDLYLGGWVQVIPETVGQYTGLHDKNGTEIYEGDVVKFEHSDNMVTDDDDNWVFSENANISVVRDFNVVDGNFGDQDYYHSWTVNWAMDADYIFEVIGNIHEHEGLLHDKD